MLHLAIAATYDSDLFKLRILLQILVKLHYKLFHSRHVGWSINHLNRGGGELQLIFLLYY